MEIIKIQEKEKWNRIVKGFQKWDIYYLNEYAHSFKLHGDGEPLLIYYEKKDGRLCDVVMQQDIAQAPGLRDVLPVGACYDWSTPYGYGGPLTEGMISDTWIWEFMNELTEWCRANAVVSQFFRFHPLLQNQKILEKACDVIYLKKTVEIDTSDEETIFRNMTPNNRNMVRKAQKNGIEIVTDKGERLAEFRKIYEETMKNNNAEEYYYFGQEYFDYLIKNMQENIIFFYALYQGKAVSAAIFFYNSHYMHYHLSGTLPKYRSLSSTNLLLTRAACWAAEHGIQYLHLGGGVGIEDSLLSFKKNFNRNGLVDCCIGRSIFQPEEFERLVELRKQNDSKFDDTKPFLIKYRG